MTRLSYEAVEVRRGSVVVLGEVDLSLEVGQFVALVGANGSGKTTLLRAGLGLLRPSRGRVTIDGDDVWSMTPRERAARLAWLPQHTTTNEPLQVGEVVAAGRYRFGENATRAHERARLALARVGAEALADRTVLDLSGGERQRVALATLLAQEAPLALLDEPANHLDPKQQIETYATIGGLWQQGLGVLCVTHDINLLLGLPQPERVRVIGLANGRVRLDTPLTAPDLPAQLEQLFDIPLRAFDHGARRVIMPWPTGHGDP